MKRSKYKYSNAVIISAGAANSKMVRGKLLLYMAIICTMFISVVQQTVAQEISGIRESYFSMQEKECKWMEIADQIKDTADPVLLAYKGASMAASANCVDGALNRLKRFKQGKQKLEKAVALNPDNMEIRFLRYSVKVKSPGILNYNDSEGDKNYIMSNLFPAEKNHDDFLLHEICSFMLDHGNLNESERQKIENIYP